MPSPYSTIWIAADSSDGGRKVPIKIAEDFLRENSVLVDETTRDIDDLLLALTNKEEENSKPLLCLRCRISRPVFFEINSLYNKFKSQYPDLEKVDMAACLLNDSGEIYLRGSPVNTSDEKKTSRKLLTWNVFQEMKDKGSRPFGVEVIQTFDAGRGASLSTWAKRKVLGNSELKKHFVSAGLLLNSPWSLIADSSTKRVKEACERFGIWGDQANDLEKLHSSYLIHYPKAKERHREKTGKNYGWEPDREFLKSLNPKQENEEKLLQLDRVIRDYINCGKNNVSIEENIEKFRNLSDVVVGDEEDNNSDNSALIKTILSILKTKALQILRGIIDADSLKWEKKPERKLVWELYSKGFSQREIASRCERGQAFVSKLLKEKQLTESIAQESALELIKLPEFCSVSQDPEDVDRMIGTLRNHLTSSEQEGDIPPLCHWIFEIINS